MEFRVAGQMDMQPSFLVLWLGSLQDDLETSDEFFMVTYMSDLRHYESLKLRRSDYDSVGSFGFRILNSPQQ